MSSGIVFTSANFNWQFLLYLIVCGIVSVFFLLYFNRVFAYFVSWGLRTWTWHQYRVYIKFEALQISLLGGRIFFTGLRYHGDNETIFVQNGYITWSYWLRWVREVNIGKARRAEENTGEPDGAHPSKLPCRIGVSLLGLEWFIYNRIPAYDSILSGLAEGEKVTPWDQDDVAEGMEESSRLRRTPSGRGRASDDFHVGEVSVQTEDPPAAAEGASSRHSSSSGPQGPGDLHASGSRNGRASRKRGAGKTDELPLMLELFPVHLEVNKAALVMGNENTRSVLIIKADSFSGEIDASETHAPDPYRQLFRIDLQHPVIEMKENLDFKEDQADRATREKHNVRASAPVRSRHFIRRQRRRVLGRLRDLVPYWRKSVESFATESRQETGTAEAYIPGFNHWQGLSRYLYDDGDDQKARWAAVEYAALQTILDSPKASLTIFWDVPGKVALSDPSHKEWSADVTANINGCEPPAWAINLSICGGSVNYGPWADRQRAELQRIFVPSLCKDATPARPISAGRNRVPTQFKLYVELTEEVTVRIPLREESKNWRFRSTEPVSRHGKGPDSRKARGRSKNAEQSAAQQRSYGWLDVKVAANATISYAMDMFAGPSGFSNILSMDLPSTEISSSINHELLWRSGRQRINCDLSNPLRWNGLRQWRFNVISNSLELFLLRDHVFLLIDLVDDWASGPPSEYLMFIPFKYHLNLQLHDVKLYLNVNDANIVDNPTDMEDNTYIIITSPLLQSTTCIPLDNYRPSKNSIPFEIRADTGSVTLHIPPWNTQASFSESSNVGHVENIMLEGSYNFNATTSPANTDTLILNLNAQSPVARLHGFTIRYFLKIKDNYFGEDVHFKTLEEYHRLKETSAEIAMADKPPPKKTNDMDVILNIRVDDPKVFLPANLYLSNRFIQIDTAVLSLDLRFTSYYMDLDLAVTPLNLSLSSSDQIPFDTPSSESSTTQLFIDGLNIYGNRVFGLPPTEPTYLCNWDISLGAITGECTVDFIMALARGGRAFIFTFDDDENALVTFSSLVAHDVTFLRLTVQPVCIWLHVEEAAFLFSTGPIDVDYNDWARSHYSRRANIHIPDMKLSCVNAESAARHKSRPRQPVETHALLQTSVRLATIGRKFDFSNERKIQQELVRHEDQRTHRASFLVLSNLLNDMAPDVVDPPAQSVPPIPQPIKSGDVESDGRTIGSVNTSRPSPGLRRKSSFLSLSGSSQSSFLKPANSRRSSLKMGNPDHLHPPTSPSKQHDTSPHRPSLHTRGVSSSTRHSAFYSTVGDNTDHQDVSQSSVTFSSQYSVPHFPLENVHPDAMEATLPIIETDAEESDTDSVNFNLEDIDPAFLEEDCAYSSTLIELPTGLTAFLDPISLRYMASLLSALQPSDPEDVLDSLHFKSMGEIFGMQRDQKMRGHVSDTLVSLPVANIRFINSSELGSLSPPQEEQDQYDAGIRKLVIAMRSECKWDDPFKLESKETRSSFHLRLRSMELSASGRLDNTDSFQAAVLVQLEDVIASVGFRDLSYVDVDVGNIHGSTWSAKIEYLASLVQRSSILASNLTDLLSETSAHEQNLTRFLAHRLLTSGQQAPDPAFLVRPSAVLRSAPKHLRTFDSWKLVMRLRQMWTVLDANTKEQIRSACLSKPIELPPNARQEVLAAFERWRSWDLENLSTCVLLNTIFGPSEDVKPGNPDDRLGLAVVRIKQAQALLDPGPKQNEITFLDVTTRLETKTGHPADQVDSGDVSHDPLMVLNLHCNEAAINLNWELCELANDILGLVNRMQSKMGAKLVSRETGVATLPSARKRREQTVHCVLVFGRGSVTAETINLHASSRCDGLKASLAVRTASGALTLTNLIMNSDAVTCRLQSHFQKLAKFSLDRPSIFFSHELQETETTDRHTIKTSASSKDLILLVRQDPIVLSEVLDLLVRDEVAQLYRLKDQLPTTSQPEPPQKKIFVDRFSAFRVNVAMFMDQYTISLPLLRSLTYTIRGTVARIAMAANFGREIIFDFDIKDNMHDMQVKVNNVDRSISLLQIPPTNGRITSHMGQGEHSVTAFASLELVKLDASAVYSLLSALNRPEIANSINDLQQQVKIIQEHAKEIFGKEQALSANAELGEKAEKAAVAVVYATHLTFAGLEVFGVSPLKTETAPAAEVLFCLDSVHLEMANRVEQEGPILAYPEAHINLRQVTFEILRGNAELMKSCGKVTFGALITATSAATLDAVSEEGEEKRFFNIKSDSFMITLSPDTVSTAVDVLGYMGDKISDLDTSRELEYLRRLRQSKPRITINDQEEEETAGGVDDETEEQSDIIDTFLSTITYTLEIRNVQISWLVAERECGTLEDKDNLLLSLERIEFGTRTRNSARLTFEKLLLQMAPQNFGQTSRPTRSANSALLPGVIFDVAYVSSPSTRRLAFQAVGKPLDIRLTSGFIVPAANLSDSISLSIKNVQEASQKWYPAASVAQAAPVQASPTQEGSRSRTLLGGRRLESLLINADFAGANVSLTGQKAPDDLVSATRGTHPNMPGKHGQFSSEESGSGTVLRTPGLAWKLEYRDDGKEDPSLYAEVKIDASSNVLYPSVVPLVVDISNSIKKVVSSRDSTAESPVQQRNVQDKRKLAEEETILAVDPSAVLGRMKLNLGLRVYKQEFSLSCQPIARVAATASFEDVYFTANTVRSIEQGNFFAISGAFTKLQASVQHVYSRESTGSFAVDSIFLSMMNSRHVSGVNGVSAILKFSPMKVSVNAKQLQDFLLFREIWMPQEVVTPAQEAAPPLTAKLATDTSQGHLAQRYQQVAATAAFPWTATVSITALEITLDLGQALGKPVFAITDFWISSKKTSDWEQNLCLGFQKIGIDSIGRMSGFVALQDFRLRTSIQWPEREQALNETPLVQASISFSQFRVKAAFDYQAFLVADITSMAFLMYNIRRSREGSADRLVAIFDGGAVQMFGITTSAAMGIALFEAFQRLVQERRAAFETSLREIERFMKRKSVSAPAAVVHRLNVTKTGENEPGSKSPISLDTDVVVSLKAINLGVFPGSFSDHQVLKVEALNAQARFAASMGEDKRIHSILGLTLGQLRIGLAGVRTAGAPKALGELSVEDVVLSATGSRGGTILKVPQVEAVMQTWQSPHDKYIDYIFKSAFEGKVEVGWNYSRISYIRGLWATHTKALAQAWGRELPAVTSIRVTGVPEPQAEGGEGVAATTTAAGTAVAIAGADGSGAGSSDNAGKGPTTTNKITAEVKVPQSKYEYRALEPPVIVTPQLRDMGEATPPLEWIGLHRDRLPNLMHQIVIVSLLELAGEVEDAYARILGSS